MPRESRRKRPARFTVIALAAGSALALTSCTSPDTGANPASGAPDEPVTLRMSVLGGPVQSAYAVMAKAYSEEFPNVTFEIEEVPNEQYGEVLRTQLQGGNAPEIFYVTGGSGNPHSVLPLAEAGYLVSLDGTVADELVTGEARNTIEYDGQIWAQALDFVPVSNIYNQTVAEEIGLELPFETVDDVLDACEVAAEAGKSLLMFAGAAVQNAGLTTMQMAAPRVYSEQPDWNTLRNEGEVSFSDTLGWKQSLEQILEMRDAGCFQRGAEAGAIADNTPAVAAGTALGSFGPGGLTGDMKRVNPEAEFVATAFPGEDTSQQYIFASPSNLMAVNATATAAEQAAALAFLDWIAEPTNADETASISGNLSIRAGAGAALPPQYEMIEPFFEEGNFQALPNLMWPSPEVYNALGTGVQGLFTGQTTVEAVLAAMDAAWDSAL